MGRTGYVSLSLFAEVCLACLPPSLAPKWAATKLPCQTFHNGLGSPLEPPVSPCSGAGGTYALACLQWGTKDKPRRLRLQYGVRATDYGLQLLQAGLVTQGSAEIRCTHAVCIRTVRSTDRLGSLYYVGPL